MEPDYLKARELADTVIKDNYVISRPVNMEEIAQNYGLRIIELDFGERKSLKNVSGYIDPKKKRIFIDKHDDPARKAFTIAHELGHWLLHNDKLEAEPGKYAILYRRPLRISNQDPVEAEANYFAACLLVPHESLTDIRRKTQRVDELARAFGVSTEMMSYRIKEVDGRITREE